jgi:NADPH-dependent F420 reductase
LTEQNRAILITIAVIGGTGKEGSGLAKRWANSGYRVIIGSRDAERAQQKVDELNTELGGTYLHGMDNLSAAKEANLIVVTVPYEAHKATFESLREYAQGKIVVDVTVPTMPPAIRTVYVPDGKAASLESQAILGPGAKVCAAFQNVSASHLKDAGEHVECDVLVCGDDDNAKAEVIKLAQAAGLRGLDAGPLANAVAVEALTPVLMSLNKRYKVKGAGIVITGIDLA